MSTSTPVAPGLAPFPHRLNLCFLGCKPCLHPIGLWGAQVTTSAPPPSNLTLRPWSASGLPGVWFQFPGPAGGPPQRDRPAPTCVPCGCHVLCPPESSPPPLVALLSVPGGTEGLGRPSWHAPLPTSPSSRHISPETQRAYGAPRGKIPNHSASRVPLPTSRPPSLWAPHRGRQSGCLQGQLHGAL